MDENFSTPYGGYDVLDKWGTPSWNEQTRRVVWTRLSEMPPRRFLEIDEWNTLEAVCARLLPQPDRVSLESGGERTSPRGGAGGQDPPGVVNRTGRANRSQQRTDRSAAET